ncbi:outer membrane beta-barrel protein [Rhodoblastus acidophilus]|uniref:Outer membrane beta-barrel protein n=1 Tax=Candidatus Rhodoblastus alkanivorans TaxID=2954117 RepID=A0ABS9Z5F1_9HYPH|nr:outer membrane beta-barrel protein [Candidatus Rhodoblastus alkanivorans]MCI4678427.1 outer membrane beta-barrel protein [Candidatus Rhodoblastus alkanivorans]MCI4682900.1 outer membrane beta-barrel protein [Candidatus Rhodoblastus alkanivorans]MDI4640210.1 outer membrane beta-barrel protein [Rhodoblastus acidophilus]
MRTLLLSTVAFAALAGSAFAADLPSRKEAPVYVAPVPAFSWTGFYLGADIGGAFGSTSLHSDWTGWNSHSLDTSGVMGGGYVGYNYQFNQNFVLGIEGDFQGTGANQSYSFVTPPLPDAPLGAALTTKTGIDWLASINGRVGISYDRALFYAIGGAAWAQGTASLTGTTNGIWYGTVSRTADLSGYDVGGGVEYAFTPNWVGRVEYRYYDFGNYNLSPWVAAYTPLREQTSVNTIRVGLAYLFSAPAPVVAKY